MAAKSTKSLKAPRTPKQCERADRILGAARRAFAENPFHEVLVDDVAREAGVGKGTIYRYFPDKESLYFAVIFDGIEGLQQRIRSSVTAEGEMESRIRALAEAYISFFRQNRFFFRLMNIEDSKVGGEGRPNRQRWGEERARLIDAVVEVLEQGREAGVLQIRHPRTDAQILLGMVRAMLRYNQDRLTTGQMADEIARIYCRGTCRS